MSKVYMKRVASEYRIYDLTYIYPLAIPRPTKSVDPRSNESVIIHLRYDCHPLVGRAYISKHARTSEALARGTRMRMKRMLKSMFISNSLIFGEDYVITICNISLFPHKRAREYSGSLPLYTLNNK